MIDFQQNILLRFGVSYISNFAVRPGKLFEGVDMNLTIFINRHYKQSSNLFSTTYNRWYQEERNSLFENLTYQNLKISNSFSIPKFSNTNENKIFEKINTQLQIEKIINRPSEVYYHSGGGRISKFR